MSTSIFERRRAQLEREAGIDRQLAGLPCQQDVNRILLFLRQVNRRQTEEVSGINSSLMILIRLPTAYSQLTTNLDELDRYNTILETILRSNSPCQHPDMANFTSQ